MSDDRTRRILLANVRHELRTPLNAVIGYSEMLLEDVEDQAFEAMLQNQEAAEHMGEATRIAQRFEPHLYEVSFVDQV